MKTFPLAALAVCLASNALAADCHQFDGHYLRTCRTTISDGEPIRVLEGYLSEPQPTADQPAELVIRSLPDCSAIEIGDPTWNPDFVKIPLRDSTEPNVVTNVPTVNVSAGRLNVLSSRKETFHITEQKSLVITLAQTVTFRQNGTQVDAFLSSSQLMVGPAGRSIAHLETECTLVKKD